MMSFISTMKGIIKMILDLPPQTEQIISHIATKQGQSIHDFILLSAYEKALQLSYMPNAETLEAIAELENGQGVKFNSVEELMSDIGLGTRIHQCFAQSEFVELELPSRTDYPRAIG